jgi:hypothetical protein
VALLQLALGAAHLMVAIAAAGMAAGAMGAAWTVVAVRSVPIAAKNTPFVWFFNIPMILLGEKYTVYTYNTNIGVSKTFFILLAPYFEKDR